MTWKEAVVHYFKVLEHLSGGTEERLSQDSWSLGLNTIPGPPIYQARVLNNYTATLEKSRINSRIIPPFMRRLVF